MTRNLLLAFTLLVPSLSYAAAKPMAVCINNSSGVVIARAKCKAGESPLNATTLGSQNKPGVDITSCYPKAATGTTSNGVGGLNVNCDNPVTQFVLNDGIQSSTVFSWVNDKELILDGQGVPTGVYYYTNRNSVEEFSFLVTIICCNR